MTFTATKMTDTLLETAGDDKKAGLMLKSIYLDHLKATSLFKDARFFYLNKNTNVLTTVDSHNEKLDGCYLSLDTVRGDPICSDFAEKRLGRRWKSHLRASHLTDRNAKDWPSNEFPPMSLLEMRMSPPTEGAL
jgi:hypothetical protein